MSKEAIKNSLYVSRFLNSVTPEISLDYKRTGSFELLNKIKTNKGDLTLSHIYDINSNTLILSLYKSKSKILYKNKFIGSNYANYYSDFLSVINKKTSDMGINFLPLNENMQSIKNNMLMFTLLYVNYNENKGFILLEFGDDDEAGGMKIIVRNKINNDTNTFTLTEKSSFIASKNVYSLNKEGFIKYIKNKNINSENNGKSDKNNLSWLNPKEGSFDNLYGELLWTGEHIDYSLEITNGIYKLFTNMEGYEIEFLRIEDYILYLDNFSVRPMSLIPLKEFLDLEVNNACDIWNRILEKSDKAVFNSDSFDLLKLKKYLKEDSIKFLLKNIDIGSDY